MTNMNFPADTPEAPLPFVNMAAGPESGLPQRAAILALLERVIGVLRAASVPPSGHQRG